MSSYDRPLPAIIPRPSSNVSAARQPVPMQGQPAPQDQMMTLLAMLAAGMGGAPQPQAAPMMPPGMGL